MSFFEVRLGYKKGPFYNFPWTGETIKVDGEELFVLLHLSLFDSRSLIQFQVSQGDKARKQFFIELYNTEIVFLPVLKFSFCILQGVSKIILVHFICGELPKTWAIEFSNFAA